ncbi:zf-parp-type zinc finger protein [Pyrenophora tritici-repentis]|uniref:Poly polymerase and DNA-Ligase Zn-finger region n=2 Tax=Pyrenophora tritici-repentis TaxID=45151 RepID=A0A2W1H7R9_9PLEO|nr:uncharacterized protein PTRG_02580 [Pyrenophora tritici-repentis Pt-1C-BFP]KAA8623368.1 zf-PARP multi-domain protein [Pyrenophora tritici-repentis]EDU45103.1 predicted protein [Pyrenophora tritici-repentis Pt-1C-BFP]KAF7574510.1 zf-PARP multi-domain protein [Pyrenophora tritici-repentis]KAG9386708.1 zf-PARP multi-domain protein [Pyrenophora tritici-repentis]KAI0571479.1 zf-PARP multi-domain protein [Pyrenophora tritici-repentis]
MGDEGPKWRLEHSPNALAICNQAACKRAKTLIKKGELRIGTHTLFDNGVERRWYMAWRHWACATKQQIAGLVETTDNDPTKAPDYQRLSQESQEQVRLAFESGKPADKEFKGVREDLAGNAQKYAKEYTNATGYKVDVAVRAAACRGGDCLAKGIKILRNELRLGILVPFDGEHSIMVYKHWKCISDIDLHGLMGLADDDALDGLDSISQELQNVVMETLETGKVVEPPESKNEIPVKSKKARTKTTKAKEAAKGRIDDPDVKVKDEDVEMEDAPILAVEAKPKNSRVKKRDVDDVESNSQPEPKPLEKKSQAKKRGVNEVNGSNEPEPKPVAKKTRTKKRAVKVENSSESEAEAEYVPKKSRSRAMPLKEPIGLS